LTIDANPEKEKAIDFRNRHDGVWLAYYMQHMESTSDQVKLNWDDQIVHIHRTLMMEVTSKLIIDRDVILPMDIKRIRDFYEHLKSPIRALKQNQKGDWIPFYPKTKIPDHFFHALLYNTVGWVIRPAPASFRIVKVL